MSKQFKVGDRVRLIADWQIERPEAQPTPDKGAEGVVSQVAKHSSQFLWVTFDGDDDDDRWGCDYSDIEAIS